MVVKRKCAEVYFFPPSRSGSMTGFRLLLAKLTAKELLLSLSQNDYFLVLKVSVMCHVATGNLSVLWLTYTVKSS